MTYVEDRRLKLLVPSTMTETYEGARAQQPIGRLATEARYSAYRRFSVEVSEAPLPRPTGNAALAAPVGQRHIWALTCNAGLREWAVWLVALQATAASDRCEGVSLDSAPQGASDGPRRWPHMWPGAEAVVRHPADGGADSAVVVSVGGRRLQRHEPDQSPGILHAEAQETAGRRDRVTSVAPLVLNRLSSLPIP